MMSAIWILSLVLVLANTWDYCHNDSRFFLAANKYELFVASIILAIPVVNLATVLVILIGKAKQ